MDGKFLTRILQLTVFTLTLIAVCQELEKPKEKRTWHGKVAGMVPYDFRLPDVDRLKETFWNQYESRVIVPHVFGVGWTVNLYSLLDNMGLIKTDVSEKSFLMPGEHMKEVLEHALEEVE